MILFPTPKVFIPAMIALVELERRLPPPEGRRHAIVVVDQTFTIQLARYDGFIPVKFGEDDLEKDGVQLAEEIIAQAKPNWDRPPEKEEDA